MALIEKQDMCRGFLYPAEVKRGLTSNWRPNFCVLISGEHWTDAHDWLCENATGLWKDFIRQPEYMVGFELEEDMVAFKLRWM